MVVPYRYQCAPYAQPAILTIANAYTARISGGMLKGAEEKQKSGKSTLRSVATEDGLRRTGRKQKGTGRGKS